MHHDTAPTTHRISRLPRLLRGRRHETTLMPESADFQVRVGHPDVADEDGATPCVLVATRTVDREIDELSLGLAAAGIPMVRLDSDRSPRLAHSYELAGDVIAVEGRAFRPAVRWMRYFQAGSIPAPEPDPLLAAYARDQWLAGAEALLRGDRARVLNAASRYGGPDRLEQLVHARSTGMLTPTTIVTNDVADAARRIPGRGDLLVKSIGPHFVETRPGELTGLTPRRVTRARLESARRELEPAPVIVQEYLRAPRELRVYAVAGRLFTFAVVKRSLEALWDSGRGLRIEAVPTPEDLRRPVRELVRRLRLDVAALDFLDTRQGPVFLEVNPACDWLWCERPAGSTAVSEAVRQLVATSFERQRRGAHPGARR